MSTEPDVIRPIPTGGSQSSPPPGPPNGHYPTPEDVEDPLAKIPDLQHQVHAETALQDEDALDADSRAALDSVLLLDDPGHQESQAQKVHAEKKSRLDTLRHRQQRIGNASQISAIESSGNCHAAGFYRTASWALVAVDTFAWWLAVAQLFSFARLSLGKLWSLVAALVLALMSKGIGLLFGRFRLTHTKSSIVTLDLHERFLKRLFPIPVGALAAWITLLCLAGLIGHSLKYIAPIPLVLLNGCLGLMAGVMASYGGTLRRVPRFFKLQTRIDQLERLLRVLKRHFPKLLVLVLICVVTGAPTLAAISCAVVDDQTSSVDASDREIAHRFLVATLLDASHRLGCEQLVVLRVGCTVRYAPRVRLTVPPQPVVRDCSQAQSEPLHGEQAFLNYVEGYRDDATADAVRDCELGNGRRLLEYQTAETAFRTSLATVLAPRPSADCSRITELTTYLTEQSEFPLIVEITDFIDNPPVGSTNLVVPEVAHLVLILARSNPSFARSENGLERALQVAKSPRVTLVTVAELDPGLWEKVQARRTP